MTAHQEALRDCPHAGRSHRHGTRAAYRADRCRCRGCRLANRQAEAERTRAIVMGQWTPYVDAAPTRQHLQLLRKQGLGIDTIVALSGVPRSTVRRLLQPDTADSAQARRIRPETAQRLAAINGDDTLPARRSLVDATPVHRCIAELLAAGYSLTVLAKLLGRTPGSLRRTLTRSAVTVGTARAVARLDHELPMLKSAVNGRAGLRLAAREHLQAEAGNEPRWTHCSEALSSASHQKAAANNVIASGAAGSGPGACPQNWGERP
jgi:hypothetical protein